MAVSLFENSTSNTEPSIAECVFVWPKINFCATKKQLSQASLGKAAGLMNRALPMKIGPSVKASR